MRCKSCHYSLAKLTGPPHRCPECGREFDPANPRTFDRGAEPTVVRRMARQLIIFLLAVLVLFAIFGAVMWWVLSSVLRSEYF